MVVKGVGCGGMGEWDWGGCVFIFLFMSLASDVVSFSMPTGLLTTRTALAEYYSTGDTPLTAEVLWGVALCYFVHMFSTHRMLSWQPQLPGLLSSV